MRDSVSKRSKKAARILDWILAVFVALIVLMIVAGLVTYAQS
ncbi:hypothetical protein [Palleronia marisminoris]|nr:hypothetical protein [Palleronia marisminoris]